MSRRGFLRVLGVGLVALYVKPTAVLAPEVEEQLLQLDQTDDGAACIYSTNDLVTMDEINAIMKKYYLPRIMEQLYTEGPLMRYLYNKNKTWK